MEKVRGKVFTAFFRNLGRREVYYSSNFLYKLIIFHPGIGQHKDV